MKEKPRWMKSVIEASKADLPPLKRNRMRASIRFAMQDLKKTAAVRV